MSAERLQEGAGDRETVPSGWSALDGLLPGGGLRRGSLIEWLAGDDPAADAACGAGAATLACAIACRLAAPRRARRGESRGGLIVIVDRAGWFHPPAVLPWLGAEAGTARRLMVARPSREDDEIWAIEQALRCAGVAAVVAWPRLEAAWTVGRGVATERRLAGRGGLQHWTTAMRRWQLAARSGGTVGLFVRSPAALREPSWAESRLAVTALADHGTTLSLQDAAIADPGTSRRCPRTATWHEGRHDVAHGQRAGGALLERRLRIARVGGTWYGAESAAGRPVDITIDLASGRAIAAAATAPAHRRHAVAAGGASCRAS